MPEELYREVLLERLQNPLNLGVIDQPDMEARLVNPLCGDTVLLQLKVKISIIEQAVYSGNGCAISQVSASFLAENIEGKSLDQVRRLKQDDILNLIGVSPGPARLKCAMLSFEVLEKIIEK